MARRIRKKAKRTAGQTGEKAREIPLDEELAGALKNQYEEFRQRFGRDPGPGDPVFFDPDADGPGFLSQANIEKYDDAVIRAMNEAGVSPTVIYAYKKTGLIVTASNLHRLPTQDKADWDAACQEYEDQQGHENSKQQ